MRRRHLILVIRADVEKTMAVYGHAYLEDQEKALDQLAEHVAE
ncbi:hypothetical protein GCM10009744_47700 [Kribbella alba]|uniref:Integrase n=1 Tax=Kribbella alba TaxID=190197 RepID=A0ABN2FLE1_9ACTN